MDSVLTGQPAEKVFDVDRARLIDLYLREHGFDISPYLGDLDTVSCYRCAQTQLEFFAPAQLAGPPAFYDDLYSAKKTAIYQQSKWDYFATARFVRPGDKVLDVGCGGGDFLVHLGDKYDRLGVETSEYGRGLCAQKGINTTEKPIEYIAEEAPGGFDVVVTLQVLEHIAQPRPFLEAALKATAPGGHLVIVVPNNNSFLGADMNLPLNMPPHHMGRWTRRSLEALAELFDIELVAIDYEPLADSNLGWYQAWFERTYVPKGRLARSLWHRMGFANAFRDYVRQYHHTIHGHSILAAYRKPAA